MLETLTTQFKDPFLSTFLRYFYESYTIQTMLKGENIIMMKAPTQSERALQITFL